jgi:chromosome segregation ATPase
MKSTELSPAAEAALRAEVAGLIERHPRREDLSRAVARALFVAGIHPAANVVRQWSQRGSTTDVARDLDGFWTEMRNRVAPTITGVDLPADVLQRQAEALGELWALALSRANIVLDEQRAEAAESVEHARAAAAQFEQLLQREQTERTRERQEAADAAATAQLRIDGLQARVQEIDAQRASEAASRAQALTQVASLQEQLAETQRQRTADAEQFSRDLAAERQARERSEERLSGEIRFAKLQIEEARSAGRGLKERLDAVEADKTLIERTMRQQINGQAEALGAARLELGEARGRIAAIQEERDRLTRQVEGLMHRIASLDASLAKEQGYGRKS